MKVDELATSCYVIRQLACGIGPTGSVLATRGQRERKKVKKVLTEADCRLPVECGLLIVDC